MPISVNPVTKVIDVPQSYLTVVTPGVLFELDTDQFRRDLRAWEATEAGRTEDRTHDHNPEYTVAGVTYARKVELINGYRWRLEDTGAHYTCRLAGSNNNLFDVANGVFIPHGNVTLIPGNSAGLQTVNTASPDFAAMAAQVASLLELAQADEIHTAASIVKKRRGTEDVLLQKDVSGSSLVGTLSVTDP